MNRLGEKRFKGFSAGSMPTGTVNPFALELLAKEHFVTHDLRSKSWDEFAQAGAPRMDFIFTVCDNAAHEVCPVWPGRPANAHWGIPDPAAERGGDEQKRRAFLQAYGVLGRRIAAFVDLPLPTLDEPALQSRLKEIGSGRYD